MAEGAAFIDQREAKAHPGPPLIRSDPSILFHFPHPSLPPLLLPSVFPRLSLLLSSRLPWLLFRGNELGVN